MNDEFQKSQADIPLETVILIVGGGPVGLSAAVELGQRGVQCVVVEPGLLVSRLRPRDSAQRKNRCAPAPYSLRVLGLHAESSRNSRYARTAGSPATRMMLGTAASAIGLFLSPH